MPGSLTNQDGEALRSSYLGHVYAHTDHCLLQDHRFANLRPQLPPTPVAILWLEDLATHPMLPREDRAEITLEKSGFFLYRGVQLFSPVPSWGRGEEDFFSFPETGELSIEGTSGEGATVELGEVLS